VRNHVPPLTEYNRPATFRSRGVAAPFTTPMLAGVRVRESDHSGVELIVPNPSGGRGIYILDWSGVQALCVPTMHDTILFRRFSRLSTIDPPVIRQAALAVAAEGYAGRAAISAAAAAVASDRTERLLAHPRLLSRLVEQFAPRAPNSMALTARRPELDRRTRTILHRLALSLGRPAACLACDLAAVADAFAPLGIARDDRHGRIPRMIARLDETSIALCVWLDTDIDNDIGGLGRAVAETMRTAARSSKAVLDVTQAALSDPVALLTRWARDAADVRSFASRCDWLLDGWERVCLLWVIAASDASRRAALLEMASLVPVLPQAVEEWSDVVIPWEAMNETCRVTNHQDTWRGGSAAAGWIERNEQLRAMST
jgi:hypothetical protein